MTKTNVLFLYSLLKCRSYRDATELLKFNNFKSNQDSCLILATLLYFTSVQQLK